MFHFPRRSKHLLFDLRPIVSSCSAFSRSRSVHLGACTFVPSFLTNKLGVESRFSEKVDCGMDDLLMKQLRRRIRRAEFGEIMGTRKDSEWAEE
jgi:hypothetical protein